MTSLDLFRQSFNRLESIYAAYRKQSDLSNAEYWCLIYIYDGFQKQIDISQQAFVSRQTINSAFRLLQKKGLIELIENPEDSRAKLAILTEEGAGLAKEYHDQLISSEERAWSALSEDEQAQLIGLLDKFNQQFDIFTIK